MLPFNYCNKTRYIYGEGESQNIGRYLAPLGKRILLHYGGGSILRSGLYGRVLRSLEEAGITCIPLGGVKPNPDIALVREGIELCRRESVDLVLAVGGGSVIDSAKGIALGVPMQGDVWQKYLHKGEPEAKALPVACILTLPAAGSENSPNSVLSDAESHRKLGYGHPELRPALSVVDPELFLSLPPEQMAYGACDMMCHIFERYFSRSQDTELSDALGEACMRTILEQSRILRREPKNVKAWGQLALCGSLAHNDLLGIGREQSWTCHALEHELSALYDVPHGAGLAVLVPPYLETVQSYESGIFEQWAVNVMGVTPSRNSGRVISEGIRRLRAWYRELGLPQTMAELGIPDGADFEAMALAACRVRGGKSAEDACLAGVHPMNAKEAAEVYRAACRKA